VLADVPTCRPDFRGSDVYPIRFVVPPGSGRSTLVAVV